MLKGISKVHFIGIGGYGMSALAYILLQAGYDIRGSDLKPSGLTELLEKEGSKIYIGHRAEQLGDAQLVVYSTAIPSHNPEIESAREKGIPLWHRSELLAAILNEGCGIAIAGTHGKTTTTAMVSLVMEKGGLDPTAVIGGEVSFFQGNARLGNSKYVVAEACESDHSFLRYRPYLAVVTNIEADHLEHYNGDFAGLVETYGDFINNVDKNGMAILCGDDPILQDLRPRLRPPLMSYGFSGHVDIRGEKVRLEKLGSRFQVYFRNKCLGEIVLKVPGKHNILNALAAAGVALYLGIDFSFVQEALSVFEGAKRRFEIIGEREGIMIVDDYAHHPTEIKVTLQAARQSGRRLICVFQPHRYTRTNFLWNDFVEAFDSADVILLNDIYSAGEEPIPKVTSQRLAQEIKDRGHNQVHVIKDKEELVQSLEKIAKRGDLILTMGAGDIWQVGRKFLERVPSHLNSSPNCS
ncbi:MAG: UDP-N-acetylmuramate--L-alanine ligase [Dethiobacter sp.]|nr:MAG: UDP-N-acetylmuramate--L-alanine ligase [Dethiobacter sp.]